MNKTPQDILRETKNIAIVGLSDKPDRASHQVARNLQAAGYQLYPVNPKLEQVLGRTCYPDLSSIPEPIDIVDVFRRAETCLPIAEEAAKIGVNTLWLQLGIRREACRKLSQDAGMQYIEDRCTKIEHGKLGWVKE